MALLLLVAAGGACASLQSVLSVGGTAGERLARGVTIARDEWGVPHVLAATDAQAAFGLGYVQAEDGLWQVEEAYLHAIGRAAHWHGERFLQGDLVSTGFEVERLAREEYEREPPARRAIWDAFAAGLNHYVHVSGERPRLITTFEPWMPLALPIADMACRVATFADDRAPERPPACVDSAVAIAVAPFRTASGHAFLLENARADFRGTHVPYEAAVISDQGWHFRGFMLRGSPAPHSGHNERIAWANSETAADDRDVRQVVFDDPDERLSYRVGSERRMAIEWVDTVLVNTAAGVVPHVSTFIRTDFGPVVGPVADLPDGSPGTREVRSPASGRAAQFIEMSRAHDLETFRDALAMRPLRMSNTVYADADGNIMLAQRDSVVLNPADGLIVNARVAVPDPDTTWTFDAWSSVAFGSHLADTGEPIASLAAEWEEVGGRNPQRARRLDNVVDALRAWDGAASPDSEAATLYVLWLERVQSGGFVGEFAQFRAMEAVLDQFERDWNTAFVPWGEVNRLRRPTGEMAGDRGLPVGGAPAWARGVFAFETGAEADTRERRGVAGTVSVLVVELGPSIGARSVVVFGQSTDLASPYSFDQAPLYARGELKATFFTREAVLANARRVYRP